MTLRIRIKLDNAAFADDSNGPDEVARILADLGNRLPDPLRPTHQRINLYDVNGNFVGHATIS